MKYLLTPWSHKSGSLQLQVDNKTPTKTTHIRGYGFGVTFSTHCFKWQHNFTSNSIFLKFAEPSCSK